ncbi:PHD-finger [Dictyocaulus viviparus]|uniref:PHD-finger n=1 Tax=Dictyocaulus viviparus TaxID=29172 RepID=A0A0D8XQY0_DICVI|nr:PHD-finger [Dictyocaulus viviparus]
MINESAYIELMKNCSKWNERACNERRARLRYPFFDQQTGTAHRFNPVFYRSPCQRSTSTDANTFVQYSTCRWRRRQSANSSDAIEMKMFLRDNPALDAALSTSTAPAQSDSVDLVYDYGQGKGTPKGLFDYNEEGDDDASNDDGGSDEDDWGSKRKSRKSQGGVSGSGSGSKNRKKASEKASRSSTASASARQDAADEVNNFQCTSECGGSVSAGNPLRVRRVPPSLGVPRPAGFMVAGCAGWLLQLLLFIIFLFYLFYLKRHLCSVCPASYKSLAGLAYHKAFHHNDPLSSDSSIEISPLLEISPICDLCLGSKHMNKKTKKAEDLVVCHDCGRSAHSSCLNFNENVPIIIKRYGWQCIECKSCTICGTSENDDKLLFCDDCDRGYHTYCFTPKMKSLPENEYSCSLCIKTFGANASAVVRCNTPPNSMVV